ncbi:DUF3791 domain-containing protein [Clostridium cochlearium]|uniref:DUF3791 domain-containing protein n=1 Tax=Clostridium cochlearium TaxID=1494 RepID=UPI0015710FD2|nr:DUF3791 domain-containing protein [Clostridium cochlearium]MCG4581156.1 DUF3791 domain-containing protein [Clostridium cochlearium]MCR1972360.1 DUF3791 domain-containing protein [Clostridium cochlearium]NSJ92096.1 DUF3791 domain-containing protein [Coprococcus sp. MSK.21.13]
MTNLNKEEKLIEFISFCIENYKVKYGLKGKEVSELFKEKGVIKFLTEGYEILHTQSKDYIIDEIQSYIKNRSENR